MSQILKVNGSNKMASDNSKKIWQKARPLSESWLHFASKDSKKVYERARRPNQWDIESDHTGIFWRGLDIFSKVSTEFAKERDLKAQLRKQIQDGILSGEFVAYGYRFAPSRDSKPVRIDISSSLEIDVDWALDELSTHEHSYDRVCIIPSSELKHQADKQLISSAPARIRSTIKILLAQQSGFRELSRGEQVQDVLENLPSDQSAFNGYSDESIKKQLRQMCGLKRN